MFFSDLTVDCQLLILNGIPLNDKFTARLVSKEWKRMLEMSLKRQKMIANQFATGRTFSNAFEPEITSINKLLALLTKYCPNLVKLYVDHLTLDTKSLQQLTAFLSISPHLRTISLNNCEITLNGLNAVKVQDTFCSFVRNMSNITSLQLVGTEFYIPDDVRSPFALKFKNKCSTCSNLFGLFSTCSLPNLKHLALNDDMIMSQPGCDCINLDGLESIELCEEDAENLEPLLIAAVKCKSIKSLVFRTDEAYEQSEAFANNTMMTLNTNAIDLVVQFTALQHITLSHCGSALSEETNSELEANIKNIVRTFQGQLKTLVLPFARLDETTVQLICTSCSNLEVLHFGYVEQKDKLPSAYPDVPLPGFQITSAIIMDLNKLTKLRELGLDCILVEQDEQVSLKQLVLPNLRSLSLCKSTFISNQMLIGFIEVTKRPNLGIHIEQDKIDGQLYDQLQELKCEIRVNSKLMYSDPFPDKAVVVCTIKYMGNKYYRIPCKCSHHG